MTQLQPPPSIVRNGHSPVLISLLTCLGLLRATATFAQAPMLIPEGGMIGGCSFVTGDFGFDCIPLYLSYLIRLAFGLAGGFALFNIIQGGYEYGLSGLPAGIVDKEAAKKRVTHAIVGFVVVILAFLIIDTIVSAMFVG